MEPLKNLYNRVSINLLSNSLSKYDKGFNQNKFLKKSLKDIEALEMKDRVRQISKSLDESFSCNYKDNLALIKKALINEEDLSGFILWPLSQYIEDYGIQEKNHIEETLETIAILSPRFTGEFVMREYINLYEKESMKFLCKCSTSNDHHLRRLASEATRPNLPWGKKLTDVKYKDKNISYILENLKYDKSEYVRRSVANHINDISHIDVKFVITKTKRWIRQNVDTKLIRHSLRTLLKNGNTEALSILGYKSTIDISITKAKLAPAKIIEGETLELAFEIKSSQLKKEKILIEYIISYIKKNNTYTKKVFRLSDSVINPDQSKVVSKKIPFKKVTTRKHYKGVHFIEIQINGVIFKKMKFELNL